MSYKQIKKFLLGSFFCASFLFSGFDCNVFADNFDGYNNMHSKKHKKISKHKSAKKIHANYMKDSQSYNKSYGESSNKYKRAFMGFGAGIGVSKSSMNDTFLFDTIAEDDFETGPVSAFNQTSYNAKFDYAFNSSLSYGYWLKNNLGLGLEFDYFSLRNKQGGFDSEGYIQTQVASAMAVASYFLNIKNLFAPYFEIGAGVGRTMSDGVIIDPKGRATGTDISEDGLMFRSLNKNVGIMKIGIGLSKEYKNAIVGLGYQFMKTTKIDESGDSLTVKFGGGTLKNSENFKFDDLSTANHSINISVKTII